MIMAHHGWGEELLVPALASGGSLVTMLVLTARTRLGAVRRWIRRP
jgi:hypothetical protein